MELTDGLRFIRRDRLMLAMILTLVVTNLLDAVKGSVVMPVFARDTYGSAVALGLLFGISGGGAVLGALVYSAIGHKLPRRWVFSVAFIVASLPLLVFALVPPLSVALIAQGVGGFAAGPLHPILSTISYERVPAAMRGRVFGTLSAGAYVCDAAGCVDRWLPA
jgi:MFS family permease